MVTRKEFIGETDVKNFTYRLFKRCLYDGVPPTESMIYLLQVVLEQNRPPRGKNTKNRSIKFSEAGEYLRLNPEASNRKVGKHCGVAHTTIANWKRKGFI